MQLMQHRPLGRTGLEVPAVIFGAGNVGGGVFTGTDAERTALVRRALDRGISWIDTAPQYGAGQSEENLGRILHELRPDGANPRISTKVRLAPDELDDIPAAVERSLAQSLARLQRPGVTLLQLHNPIAMERDAEAGRLGVDDVLGPGGVADALEAVRANAGTRLIGFTGLGEADALHRVVDSGRFDTVQAYCNLLNPSAGHTVPAGFGAHDYRGLAGAAAERGMGVLAIRVMAAGAIAGAAPRAGRRALSPGSAPDDDVVRARAVAGALDGEPGTLPQRAIRFALDTPGVSGALVGFSTPAQVEEAAAAAELAPLSPRALAALRGLWERDFR